MMNTVLITGAAGNIGGRLRVLLKGAYPRLRLSDRRAPTDLGADEEFVQADLADMAQVEGMLEGVDGVIHLGGQPVEAAWEVVHESNIVGLYNFYEGARRQGVKRVVFASSNHAIGFYKRRQRIGSDVTPRPDSRYGVSKVFGEAVAALYADKFGIGSLCIRIGNVADRPADKRRLSMFITPEDLAQLCRIGLDHPDIHYEIVYGASDNERSWWDNSVAYRLGYKPQAKAEDWCEEALAAQAALPDDPIGDLYQGGGFASFEFARTPEDAERDT